jgi:hypothetical protein
MNSPRINESVVFSRRKLSDRTLTVNVSYASEGKTPMERDISATNRFEGDRCPRIDVFFCYERNVAIPSAVVERDPLG